MNIKMLVTDIDGTLLPAGMEVPRRNVEAVRRARGRDGDGRDGAHVPRGIACGACARRRCAYHHIMALSSSRCRERSMMRISCRRRSCVRRFPRSAAHAAGMCSSMRTMCSISRSTTRMPRYEADQALRGEAVGWDGRRAWSMWRSSS